MMNYASDEFNLTNFATLEKFEVYLQASSRENRGGSQRVPEAQTIRSGVHTSEAHKKRKLEQNSVKSQFRLVIQQLCSYETVTDELRTSIGG